MTLTDVAFTFHQLGANVTAIEAHSKGPAHVWDRWQTERQKRSDVETLPWRGYTCRKDTKRHKAGDKVTIGAVGVISGIGGWRVFDIDAKKDPETKQPIAQVSDATVNQLLSALGLPLDYEWVWRSGSGAGWEVAIRCDEPMPPGTLTEDKREKGVFTGWPEYDSGSDWHHLELRWETCQTVVACNDGRSYAWRGTPPTKAPVMLSVRRVIAAFFEMAPPPPWNLGTVDRSVVDQIKANFDLIDYAQRELGGDAQLEGRETRITGHQGLLIDPEKGIWYIHGEQLGGDAIDLVAYCAYRTTARNLNGKSAEILERAAAFAGVSLPDRKPPPKQQIISAADAPPAETALPTYAAVPLSADELLAMDIPKPRQFVPGLIREGLSFFIGQPGVGKTPGLIQLAISYATGGLWLGAFRVPKIRVAYIGPEYDRGDVRSIIVASTGGQVALPNLHLFTVENFQPPNDEQEAVNFIDRLVYQYGIEAIIIDLFTGFLPPEKFKQNAYRGDYREFLTYHRQALKHHMALTGAWHGTKRDANPATMYNGGQGFWGAAGGGRLVMYQDEEDQVKLYSQLRGNKAITYTLLESHAGGIHTWSVLEGADPEPAFGSDVHRTVYRAIKDHAGAQGLTPKTVYGLVKPELASNTGEAYIRKCISVLAKRGILKAIGDAYIINRGSRGSQGSEGSESTQGSEGSHTSLHNFHRVSDPSDPSPIPPGDRSNGAYLSPRTMSDPSDPSLLPIPDDPDDVFFPVPPQKRTFLRLYLRSNKDQDQDRARELCQEYGIDYEQARKVVAQDGLK